jgi:hypothetical protein
MATQIAESFHPPLSSEPYSTPPVLRLLKGGINTDANPTASVLDPVYDAGCLTDFSRIAGEEAVGYVGDNVEKVDLHADEAGNIYETTTFIGLQACFSLASDRQTSPPEHEHLINDEFTGELTRRTVQALGLQAMHKSAERGYVHRKVFGVDALHPENFIG